MSAVLHIARKDVRRHRTLLALWACLVTVRCWLATDGTRLSFEPSVATAWVVALPPLLLVLETIFFGLLAALIVHEEPLVGSEAFWLTRPIPSHTLFCAKALVLVLFLVGIPAAVNAAVLVARGAPLDSHVAAAVQLALARGAWLSLAWLIASLTPSPAAFVLTVLASLVSLAVLLVLSVGLRESMGRPSSTLAWLRLPPAPLPNDAGGYVGLLVTVTSLLAIIRIQYGNRRRFVTAVGGAMACVLALSVSRMPWAVSRAAEPLPARWAIDPVETPIGLRESALAVSTLHTPWMVEDGRRWVVSGVFAPALPSGYSGVVHALDSHLLPRDGGEVSGRGGWLQEAVRKPKDSKAGTWYGLLDRSPIVNPWNSLTYEQRAALMVVQADDYERLKRGPIVYRGELELRLTTHRVTAALPIGEGVSFRGERYVFEVLRAHRRSQGWSLLVRESYFPTLLPVVRPQVVVVMRNRRYGQSVLPAIQERTVGDPLPGLGYTLLRHGMRGVVPWGSRWQVLWTATFNVPSARDATASVDPADWLADAELLLLESKYAGRVRRTVSFDGLALALPDARP